jgi:hypothetical protein
VPEWHYDEHVQMDVDRSANRQTDDGEPQFVTDSLYVRREA